jgi:hypothetical protein
MHESLRVISIDHQHYACSKRDKHSFFPAILKYSISFWPVASYRAERTNKCKTQAAAAHKLVDEIYFYLGA